MYVARNKDGTLCLFYGKPVLNDYNEWWFEGSYRSDEMMTLDNNLLPEVTFENSPKEIILSLKDD